MATVLIPLTQGKFATVDEADYPKVAPYKWSYAKRKRERTGYARACVTLGNGKQATLYMHRLLLDAPKATQVDHMDGDGLNNTRDNLRLCSWSQNQHNQQLREGSSSRFKGVSWFKPSRRWKSEIKHNRKPTFLGYFDSEEDAARAYDAKARELHGEFARLNFPIGDARPTWHHHGMMFRSAEYQSSSGCIESEPAAFTAW